MEQNSTQGTMKPSAPAVPDSVEGAARELYQLINNSRRRLKSEAAEVKRLAGYAKAQPVRATFAASTTPTEDRGETIANLMLTYRHLEDASMRLGKALQAIDGGVSVYDTATTVGAPSAPSGAD